MDEQQKLREQAWAVMKHMHDHPGEPQLSATGGWCAPSEVIYSYASIDLSQIMFSAPRGVTYP